MMAEQEAPGICLPFQTAVLPAPPCRFGATYTGFKNCTFLILLFFPLLFFLFPLLGARQSRTRTLKSRDRGIQKGTTDAQGKVQDQKRHKNTLNLYLRLVFSTETAHNNHTKEPQQTLGKRFWLSRIITFVRFKCTVFNYKKSQATQRNREVWPSQREKKLTETVLKEDERADHQRL